MKANLSHTEIIETLKADKTHLQKEFGVINIGLFGFYAKYFTQSKELGV
jgi:hypothetical protein